MCKMNYVDEALEKIMNPWVGQTMKGPRADCYGVANYIHEGMWYLMIHLGPGKPGGQRHYIPDTAIHHQANNGV